jgi:hypothetical protein
MRDRVVATRTAAAGKVMQQELFPVAVEPEPSSPLHGVRIKVEARKHCCDDIAIVRPGKGPHAHELRCEWCGKHRAWLPKEAAAFLLETLRHFPDAREQIHTIRMEACNGNS